MKPRLSLKGRGLQILAQREHSRSELRRKLLSHARAAAESQADTGAGTDDTDTATATAADLQAQVDAVLDWLQAHQYLSEARFVESRVHVRAARYGNLRIQRELAQHAVALGAEASQQLKDSEAARARDVWSRKFGQPPQDAAERARQMRFLAARGFSGEAIRRALQAGADEE